MKTIDKPETHTGDIEELHENNRQARNPHRRHRRTT